MPNTSTGAATEAPIAQKVAKVTRLCLNKLDIMNEIQSPKNSKVILIIMMRNSGILVSLQTNRKQSKSPLTKAPLSNLIMELFRLDRVISLLKFLTVRGRNSNQKLEVNSQVSANTMRVDVVTEATRVANTKGRVLRELSFKT